MLLDGTEEIRKMLEQFGILSKTILDVSILVETNIVMECHTITLIRGALPHQGFVLTMQRSFPWRRRGVRSLLPFLLSFAFDEMFTEQKTDS